MEENHTHSAVNGVANVGGNLVGNEVMTHMSPPKKHVDILKSFFGKLVNVIEGVGGYLELVGKNLFKLTVNTLGVYVGNPFLGFFVNIFDSSCYYKFILYNNA